MAQLLCELEDIPDLTGKVSIITGGASGIGLASARILASKGCAVHVLDLTPMDGTIDSHARPDRPSPTTTPIPSYPLNAIRFHKCDIADWTALRSAFKTIGHVDIAVANAGISQEADYFADTFDDAGELLEPEYHVINVNYRAVLNFTKLALRAFRHQGPGGSLVITSSATAYSPEQSLPVYSATKLALVGLIRALRSNMKQYGATINGVAPAATITKLLPGDLAAPIIAAGAPVSSAYHVGLAVVYSATAHQPRMVEGYGRDKPEEIGAPGRWNGRVIMTLGDGWVEVEEPIARLREQWMGKYFTEKTAFQQVLTDQRAVCKDY